MGRFATAVSTRGLSSRGEKLARQIGLQVSLGAMGLVVASSVILAGVVSSSAYGAGQGEGFDAFYRPFRLAPKYRFDNYSETVGAAVKYISASFHPNPECQTPTLQKESREFLNVAEMSPMASPVQSQEPCPPVVKTGRCSAAIVSRQGHLLTALHCLRSCLADMHQAFENVERKVTVPWPTPQGQRTFSVKYQVTKTATPEVKCPIQIQGRKMWADVEFVGPGLSSDKILPSEMILPPIQKILKSANVHMGAGDIAVLKVPDLEALKVRLPGTFERKYHCAALSTQGAAPSEPVWALGFPRPTDRSWGLNSDGESLYVSMGSALSSFRETKQFQLMSRTLPEEELLRVFSPVYQHPNIQLSDVDIASGSSGGMIVNHQGQIVGTAVLVAEGPRSSLANSEQSVFHRSESILRLMKQALSSRQIADIFGCTPAL